MRFKYSLAVMLMVGSLTVGCEKPAEITSTKAPMGPNERFYEVQQKLDQGGTFYMYVDLKDALRGFLDQIKPMTEVEPQAQRMFAVAETVIDKLGIFGIHDVGMSSLPEGDLYRNKFYISSPDGRQGLLKVLGGEPHDFALLDRASSATLAMVTADIDAQAAWELVMQLAAEIGGEQATAQITQGMAMMSSQTGINPSMIIPAMSGQINFVIEADPTQKLFLPLGTSPIQVDSPRMALMIGVTDSQLYDALRGLAQRNQAATADETVEGDLHLTSLVVPPNPLWAVVPAIGFDGKFVYLTTHGDYVKALCKPAEGTPTLRQNPEFMTLTKDLPTQGNGMIYVSGRLEKMAGEIFEAGLAGIPNDVPPSIKERMVQLKGAAFGSVAMRINEPGGVMFCSRSKAGSARYLGAASAAPVAILAAIAVPNFMEAQSRAKVSRAQADLRTLTTALESYNIDTNAYPAWSADPAKNAFGSYPQLAGMPTLANSEHPDGAMGLTTPITYISSYPTDPFAPAEGATFCYWRPEDASSGWIAWSVGPDGSYNLTLDNIAQAYDPAQPVPSPMLIGLTYDPSNGTSSSGDIWRVKQ